ncbi:hypothetical protein [Alteromonas sp. 07-89-2]|uniref:hypothetical protein n=1 Tax=Alteromonas sp. 07-89-2 TaxID=2607609 RepID=UPI00148D632F|nr:hypothetical protein [Alteromonas sp. 07-89-2]
MEVFNSRKWMYCGAVLIIPTAALFKSLIEWAVPLYLVAILLVFLDPYFKELRSQQTSANRYIIVILPSGLVAGIISNVFPQAHAWLVSGWFLFFVAYGWPIATKIDRNNGS